LGIIIHRSCGGLGIFLTVNDDQFRQLLDYFHYSWGGYRKVRKGVKKRISRHMQQLQCSDIGAYLAVIESNTKVRQECERRMTVSISRFFRDRKLWFDLENEIIPGLLETEREKLKVWSAGCACGEEAYSFMMVWDHLKGRLESLPELELIATDKHPDYIDKAESGIYTKSSLKEVPQEMRNVYFERKKGGNRFDLKSNMKKHIVWHVNDLLSDPPGSDFHIIFLRNNLLTYYRSFLVEAPFNKIMDSLIDNGWLIIGSHEKLPKGTTRLIRKRSTPWAYRKAP
jgi:chemotaxis methyl-accepting protein methylase